MNFYLLLFDKRFYFYCFQVLPMILHNAVLYLFFVLKIK